MAGSNLIIIAALLVTALAVYVILSKLVKTAMKIVLFLLIVAALYFFVFKNFL